MLHALWGNRQQVWESHCHHTSIIPECAQVSCSQHRVVAIADCSAKPLHLPWQQTANPTGMQQACSVRNSETPTRLPGMHQPSTARAHTVQPPTRTKLGRMVTTSRPSSSASFHAAFSASTYKAAATWQQQQGSRCTIRTAHAAVQATPSTCKVMYCTFTTVHVGHVSRVCTLRKPYCFTSVAAPRVMRYLGRR